MGLGVCVSDMSFYHGKQVVRGALTNGREWIFLILKLNDDRNGASFMQSDTQQ
jgi:hypothetical protein